MYMTVSTPYLFLRSLSNTKNTTEQFFEGRSKNVIHFLYNYNSGCVAKYSSGITIPNR